VPCIFKKSAMNNELPFIFTEQLAKNKIEVVYAKVLNIENTSMQIKKVSTSLQVYYGKYVILATGIKNSSVQTAINTEKYYGRGLSFCAPCDVIYYLRKNVAVTGNNEYGAKIALYLSEFVNEVHYVISDSFLVASKVVIQNIMANKKIQVYYGSTLSKVNGELAIESADIIHQKTGIQLKLEIVAWFCYDRFQGNIDFVKAGVIGDNYIGTSYNMETNIPGIYAVGAVRESGIKRLVYCFSDALTAVNEIDHNLYFQK